MANTISKATQNNVGISKEQSMLGHYDNGSVYSTQDGNAAAAGQTVVGGFTKTGEYTEQYTGRGTETIKELSNFEIFDRISADGEHAPIYGG